MNHLRLSISLAGACGLLLAACSTAPPRPLFSTAGDLTDINILTAPVGLDLDDRPGLDGFSIKVFASIPSNPKPVPIRSGTLEIVMFDGTLFGRSNLPPALKIWSYAANELSAYEFTARIGTGYEFLLTWGTNVPKRRMISVGARYTSKEGKILTSSLSSVTVLDVPER